MNSFEREMFVSDVHLGDGSRADMFDRGTRRQRFSRLLDYARDLHARPIVLGDLGDCLIANTGAILDHYRVEFDRLARMETRYVPGNHCAHWGGRLRETRPGHPFFDRTTGPFVATFGGRRFLFCHGHEGDRYCNRPYPDADAITALLTARRARRRAKAGAALARPYADIAIGAVEKIGSLCRWLARKPSRLDETIDEIEGWRSQSGAEVVVCGHTHVAGRIGPTSRGWHYNAGCLCGEEGQETFGMIDRETGDVQLYRWSLACEAIPCEHELRPHL